MLTIYGKDACPNCDRAKALLKSKGIDFEYLKLGVDYTRDELLSKVPDARQVPIIFDGDVLIGGYVSLCDWVLNVDK